MTTRHTSPIAHYDIAQIRAQFPILSRRLHTERDGGVDLVYLDNAASAQKPLAVLEKTDNFYRTDYANVHRGLHSLSEAATNAYENARAVVAKFIGADDPREIIWTRNGTEALNLVADSFGHHAMKAGDNVVISHAEHHSNIVPWQLLAKRLGIELKVIPITDEGRVEIEKLDKICTDKTRLISLTHISNSLGMRSDIERAIAYAKTRDIAIMIDGCQGAVHERVDVSSLGCDFYVMTGHKLYGPSGIGVLWGRMAHLEAMAPYQGGGEMIHSVRFEGTTFAPPPAKFEAGTPPIAQAIGLGYALDFIESVGREKIHDHERALTRYAATQLAAVNGVQLIGRDHERGIISLVLTGVHSHDIATFLDHQGVAIRAGHHCAEPVMERLNLPGTVRVSLAMYNSREDIDALVIALDQTAKFFQ